MKSSICLLFLILPVIAFPQTQVKNQVVGIVYQQNSKIPIARANVSIPGVGSAVTGSNGEFSIGLSQCSNCVVGKAFKIYVNSDYGYGESEYVIPTDPNLRSCEVAVSPNKKLSINGFV